MAKTKFEECEAIHEDVSALYEALEDNEGKEALKIHKGVITKLNKLHKKYLK